MIQNSKQTALWLIVLLVVWMSSVTSSFAQTPTPTPNISFQQSCLDATENANNLLNNSTFDSDLVGWRGIEEITSPDVLSQVISDEETNYFLRFQDGNSIVQVPGQTSAYTRFTLQFCYVISEGGQFTIEIGDTFVDVFPQSATIGGSGQYTSSSIPLNLSSGSTTSGNTLRITYTGPAGTYAFIDNIELFPYISSSDDPDETATPTPEESGPTATPVPGEPVDIPTYVPGMPSPTPTPNITNQSVRMIASPPMLLVSQDDFVGQLSNKKQVRLDLQVIGSDGEEIDITNVDSDATIRLRIDTSGDAEDVGILQEKDGTSFTNLNQTQTNLSDLNEVYFFPLKAYDGTVRIVADIEYKTIIGDSRERIKIRGVIPIVMRVDPNTSLTNATGTFSPSANYRLGRSPGDRGYRPDVRTNLFFKERVGQ
jgi:hypothetical protein